jgi:hypothetical protein
MLTTHTVKLSLSALTELCSVLWYTPVFLLPALVVLLLGFWLGNVYIKVQLAVKREMANAKSPILGIVGSAINGLGTSYDISEYRPSVTLSIVSIRAYAAQRAFRHELLDRINIYTRTGRIFWCLNRYGQCYALCLNPSDS